MTPAAERRPLLPFAWARAHHLVLPFIDVLNPLSSRQGLKSRN
ncbi:hypothetical protein ACQSAS_23200, partial [Klebsiella pneumoniae]